MSLLNAATKAISAGVDLWNAGKNRSMQKDFATHGIRWKVKDAKKAGIHPLYALGAQTTSFSPVSVGGATDAIASMGQDVSRAIDATRTQPEKLEAVSKTMQDLQIRRMGLENELLGAQIAKLRQTQSPGLPSNNPGNLPGQGDAIVAKGTADARPPLSVGGSGWGTSPGTVNAEDVTKRYGETVGDFLYPPVVGIADAWWNLRNRFIPWLRSKGRPGPLRSRSIWN